MARPKKEIAKNERFELRLTEEQSNVLTDCAKQLNTTRTETLLIGLNLVNEMVKDSKK